MLTMSTDLIVQYSLGATIFLDSILLIFIFGKTRQNLQYILLQIHLLGILGWAISVILVLRLENIVALHFTYAFAVILAVSKYYFTYSFPENKLPIGVQLYTPLVIAFTLLTLSIIPNALFTGLEVIDSYYAIVHNGPLALIYLGGISYFLITPIYILVQKYRAKKYTGIMHEQIKYLLAGITIFFVVGLGTNSILPVFFQIYFFNGLGPVFSLIFASFIFYIITKHHFLDLRIIIQRSLIYAVLFLFVVCMYVSAIHSLELLFHRITTLTTLFSGIVTTLVATFTVPHIDAYLRKKTDPVFFKGTYHYNDALHTMSEILNHNISFTLITAQLAQSLQETLKASSVEFSFPMGTKTALLMSKQGIHIPILFKNQKIGVLYLGEKLSGDVYTSTDKQLLNTLSHQVATSYQRAMLHKEVEDYSHKLEKMVAKRTSQLTESYNHQHRMIYDISHSLQTPLTVIKSELENIKSISQNTSLFETFETSVDDITKFIHDFLKLTEIESEENEPPMDTLNLSEFLSEIVEYIAIIAKEKDIVLYFSATPQVYVIGSVNTLRELLLSLLSNSMKYMNSTGKKEIHVSLSCNITEAIISIKDTGIGIQEEELPHIFNRLYRSSQVKHIRGSGLGLSIAKSITEKHHGIITAASTFAVGTTFTITLPKIISNTPKPQTAASTDLVETAS